MCPCGTQPDDQKKRKSPEVSKPGDAASVLRKRLTAPPDLKITPPGETTAARRPARLISPKNKSLDEFSSSDCEIPTPKSLKNYSYKNEEKSQLICYKDSTKIVAIKNDSKLTKYNTFDIKCGKKGKLTKFKSLDDHEPPAKALVRYYDTQSNVAIPSRDFGSDFKLLKYDRRRPKGDIICDTVDAWAKKNSKNVFSNLKNSLFKNSSSSGDKDVVYKPLVFGGTFPIDAPTDEVEAKSVKVAGGRKGRPATKFREYGPAKSFDIDLPI